MIDMPPLRMENNDNVEVQQVLDNSAGGQSPSTWLAESAEAIERLFASSAFQPLNHPGSSESYLGGDHAFPFESQGLIQPPTGHSDESNPVPLFPGFDDPFNPTPQDPLGLSSDPTYSQNTLEYSALQDSGIRDASLYSAQVQDALQSSGYDSINNLLHAVDSTYLSSSQYGGLENFAMPQPMPTDSMGNIPSLDMFDTTFDTTAAQSLIPHWQQQLDPGIQYPPSTQATSSFPVTNSQQFPQIYAQEPHLLPNDTLPSSKGKSAARVLQQHEIYPHAGPSNLGDSSFAQAQSHEHSTVPQNYATQGMVNPVDHRASLQHTNNASAIARQDAADPRIGGVPPSGIPPALQPAAVEALASSHQNPGATKSGHRKAPHLMHNRVTSAVREKHFNKKIHHAPSVDKPQSGEPITIDLTQSDEPVRIDLSQSDDSIGPDFLQKYEAAKIARKESEKRAAELEERKAIQLSYNLRGIPVMHIDGCFYRFATEEERNSMDPTLLVHVDRSTLPLCYARQATSIPGYYLPKSKEHPDLPQTDLRPWLSDDAWDGGKLTVKGYTEVQWLITASLSKESYDARIATKRIVVPSDVDRKVARQTYCMVCKSKVSSSLRGCDRPGHREAVAAALGITIEDLPPWLFFCKFRTYGCTYGHDVFIKVDQHEKTRRDCVWDAKKITKIALVKLERAMCDPNATFNTDTLAFTIPPKSPTTSSSSVASAQGASESINVTSTNGNEAQVDRPKSDNPPESHSTSSIQSAAT